MNQIVKKSGKTINVNQLQKTIYNTSNSVRQVLEMLNFSSSLVNHCGTSSNSFTKLSYFLSSFLSPPN